MNGFIGMVAFEWRYLTRRMTFLASALLFGAMGFNMSATGFGDPEIAIFSGYAIAHSMGLLSLASIFVLTMFSVQCFLRDSDYGMTEIVLATSIRKAQYLGARFGAMLLASASVLAFAGVGMVLGGLLMPHESARLGTFDLFDYLWVFVVLVLPNLFFVASALTAIAVLSRSSLGTYLGGVFLYLLYFAVALLSHSPIMAGASPPSPEGLARAALADPFGLSAFFEQTHYWTQVERNLQRLALDGYFLGNRLLWLVVSIGILAAVYRLFALRLPSQRSKGRQVESSEVMTEAIYRSIPGRSGSLRAVLLAGLSTTRLEVHQTLAGWPFLALLATWVGVIGIEVTQRFGRAEFGTTLLPTTGLLIEPLQSTLSIVALFVIVYFSAEMAWRERLLGLQEIVDATPTSNAVFLLAKCLALVLLVAVLILAAIAVAVAYQLLAGYTAIEPALYLSIFYFTGLPLALVVVLAFAIQSLSPQRHLGMLVTAAAILFWHRGALGGPDHPLLRFASAPSVSFSAMGGYSPEAGSFPWFASYWGAFTGLLFLLTCTLWRRGGEARLRSRWRAPLDVFKGRTRWFFLAFSLVFASTGLWAFYQTDVMHAEMSEDQRRSWEADYERRYRFLRDQPQPEILEVRSEIDLYPRQRRFELRAAYDLENRSEEPIAQVFVSMRRDLDKVRLDLDGRAPSDFDADFRVYRFDLEPALGPGERSLLSFDFEVDRRGLRARGSEHDIVANGSFLLMPRILPSFGYQRSYEIRDENERRREGLPEGSRARTLEESLASGENRRNPGRILVETLVSTPADQTAVVSGELQESWESGGRRFFRYRVKSPIRPLFALVSARYAFAQRQQGDVRIEVYSHPGHGANIELMLEAASRSLEYCSREFGPYAHDQLRLVEIPSFWDGFAGLALPGMTYFVEDHLFLTDRRQASEAQEVDLVTKRVAHEVAHQWWGHGLEPYAEPGASVLVETLARYTELMVLKGIYGEPALAGVLRVERDRYLSGRARGEEVPLYQAEDQGYLYYSKGALVMMAVHDLIGEEAINDALRGLLAKAGNPDDPPTSLDLVEELRRVTPARHHELLDQWWKEIGIYDLTRTSRNPKGSSQ